MAHVTPKSAIRERQEIGNTQKTDAFTGSKSHHEPDWNSSKIRGPNLFHRVNTGKSILSLLTHDSKIFAGTQSGDLLVWSLDTFELLANIHAHRGSVLCLYLSPEDHLLFSSAGDAIVNVGTEIVTSFQSLIM